jgi:hypothetical protein
VHLLVAMVVNLLVVLKLINYEHLSEHCPSGQSINDELHNIDAGVGHYEISLAHTLG